MAPKSPAKSVPADILTYSFQKHMVYVTPADSYEVCAPFFCPYIHGVDTLFWLQKAIEYAQAVFPELKEVSPDRISFEVRVRANGGKGVVRIGPMAWLQVIQTLSRYEIIDIRVENFVPPPGYMPGDSENDVYLNTKNHLGRTSSAEIVQQRSSSPGAIVALVQSLVHKM